MTGPFVVSHNHCVFEVGARGIKKNNAEHCVDKVCAPGTGLEIGGWVDLLSVSQEVGTGGLLES